MHLASAPLSPWPLTPLGSLSQYHKTIEAVYSVENSVETLLDLLQRYREKAGDKVAEKGGSIFTKACFLLALLLQDKHRAVVGSLHNLQAFEKIFPVKFKYLRHIEDQCTCNLFLFFPLRILGSYEAAKGVG